MGRKSADTVVYEMKIIQSVDGTSTNEWPYRILGVPSDWNLYKFAEAITESFDFYFDHPFGFYDDSDDYFHAKEGYELFADIGEESEFKGVKKTVMKVVFGKPEREWLFLFDYGDEWHFIVRKIGEMSYDKRKKYPILIRSENDALPQYPDYEDDE